MKKSLFLFIMCLFVGQIWAQIPQGARLVSGSISTAYNFRQDSSFSQIFYAYDSSTYRYFTKTQTSIVNLSPIYSVFVKPNLSRDMGFNIYWSRQVQLSLAKDIKGQLVQNSIGIGASYGYTKWIPLKYVHPRLFFTLSASFNPYYTFSRTNSSFKSPTKEVEYSSGNYHALALSLQLKPGLYFQVTDKWLVSATFGAGSLTYTKGLGKDYLPSQNLSMNLNTKPSAWSIGIGYFLAPKS